MKIWIVLFCATAKPPVGSADAARQIYADCSISSAHATEKGALEAVEMARHNPEAHGKIGLQKVRLEFDGLEDSVLRVFGASGYQLPAE